MTAPAPAAALRLLFWESTTRCNLACRHCHVDAGPERREGMPRAVMDQCLEILKTYAIPTVDITGGSPEMHPHIPWLLRECAGLGRRVVVRTNGAILLERGYESFVDFYAEHGVEVVVSLPHMDPNATDRQREIGERRVGKECLRLCRSRWSPYH